MNNKRIFCILLLVPVALFMLSSCSKSFLNVTPKGSQIAQKVNDYNQLLNIDNLSSYPLLDEVLGDEGVAADPWFGGTTVSSLFLRLAPGFKYQADIYQPTETAAEMYSFLQPVYTYNKIINEVMDATDSSGSAESPSAIRAEAMADRAWSYLWLINYFGKPYDASTATTDPGFPIVTTSDVTQSKFDRGTVQGTYDFIINDLKSAIPDLPVAITNKYRMSRPAAEAILGKVYWFMAKYDSALIELNAAFADLGQNGSLSVKLYNLAVEMTPGGVYSYIPGVTSSLYINGFANYSLDNEALFTRPFEDFNVLTGFALMPASVKKLYTTSDLRLDYFSTSPLGGGKPIDSLGDMRRIGPLTTNIFGVNLPDMYLMRAECEVRTGSAAAAISDLQTLRQNRMSTADAVVPGNLSQLQLTQFILNERIREFALTGMRWFDMRRLSTDPDFKNVTYTHIYHSSTGTQTFTLQQPDRFTIRFPQQVIDENPGMQNNP